MNILIGTIFLWALALFALRLLRKSRPEAVPAVIARARTTTIYLVPRVFAGLLGAGFMAELLPVDKIEQYFGEGSGLIGVGLASVLGVVTPGGPFVAFAVGASALKAGAGWAPLVAYVTAFSVININRSLVYEIPLMGRQFTLIRMLVSVPLSLVLGGIALLF
ncbi:hypothetical protein [Actibacterium sp.]|uniref:hypothetical protein n=1 Tax=Actibacterium sp. TaxID=1872125 RepID=UPI0035614113